MSLTKYIKTRKNKKQIFYNIEVNEYHPLPDNISIKNVLTAVRNLLPSHLLNTVKTINIGKFAELKRRKIQAYYDNKSIFMTNDQIDENDMIDDIIHEIAHAVEEKYYELIYSDSEIEKEFIQKRLQLRGLLKSRGFKILDLEKFTRSKYSEEFDSYLHSVLGYSALRILTANIFYSPYAATSLREYFANGFEAFYFKKHTDRIQKISPKLYIKLRRLIEDED